MKIFSLILAIIIWVNGTIYNFYFCINNGVYWYGFFIFEIPVFIIGLIFYFHYLNRKKVEFFEDYAVNEIIKLREEVAVLKKDDSLFK